MIDYTMPQKKSIRCGEWVKKKDREKAMSYRMIFFTRTEMMQNEYGNENEVNTCVVFSQNLFLPFQHKYDVKLKDRVSEELLDRTSKSKKINLT